MTIEERIEILENLKMSLDLVERQNYNVKAMVGHIRLATSLIILLLLEDNKKEKSP